MNYMRYFQGGPEANGSFASHNIHHWLDIRVLPSIKAISVGTPFH